MQRFGERLHRTCLSGSGRTQQQEDAGWPVVRRQAGLEHLHVRKNGVDGAGLADHAG